METISLTIIKATEGFVLKLEDGEDSQIFAFTSSKDLMKKLAEMAKEFLFQDD